MDGHEDHTFSVWQSVVQIRNHKLAVNPLLSGNPAAAFEPAMQIRMRPLGQDMLNQTRMGICGLKKTLLIKVPL